LKYLQAAQTNGARSGACVPSNVKRLESKEPPSRPWPGSARQPEVRASGSGAGDLSCRLRIARKIFPSHPALQSRVRIGEQTQAHRKRKCKRLTGAFALRPPLLPSSLLLLLASVGATAFVGNRIARRAGIEVEGVLWRTLLVGLLAARLAFVL